jgi:acetoacetyl-CoA reductase
VLVNNAGITRDMTFKKMTKADWDAVMHTNLDSVFNMTKQVMDGMVERKWGRVINVSSVNGQKGAFGQTNYSAAKAGMHGFTKAWRWKWPSRASRSTPFRRAISAPRW